MDALKEYLDALPDRAARDAFAHACGTSLGRMRNIAYGFSTCPSDLAAAIERSSEGVVHCEAARPDIAWARIQDAAWPWHPMGRPLVDVAAEITAQGEG